MAQIDAFFKLMNDEGASDLHMVADQQPVLRIRGDMERVKFKKMANEELKAMLYEICPEDKIKLFEETGDIDFGYEIPGLARYRCNFFQQKYGIGAVFREIPSDIMSCEQLGLPKVISRLAHLPKGLVLVTGPTGSGKSTTLAAIVDEANKTRKDHILTIEDPIEFVHRSQNCVINHREVGTHTRGFGQALRGALREDPDIIMVGEMRDLETISLAMEAAMTGHLVFGTLHTLNAMKTVDRVIEIFPATQQGQVRSTLADALKAVVSQTLFKRTDIKGRCAALEILIATPAVRNLIREGKTYQILSAMQTGKKYGMQTMDDAILNYLEKKMISSDDAYSNSIEKAKFLKYLRKPPSDFTEV
ncbi:MAG: type IV pilus twitching motility protein PilT [Desulfocapsaceae bacterium]|jgi:twitching motility protein PilT|nr:type IV pilus twitching motility protein PilT [Desulfocapsaceae bacterium]